MTITDLRAMAGALTNEALAERLDKIANFPRTFSTDERTAFLLEAAERISTGTEHWR